MQQARSVLLILWLTVATAAASAQDREPTPWRGVQRLVGEWSGTSTGRPGDGTVLRRYEFVLGGRYIRETSTSIYPPQERNRKGEVHEHWGMLSYDRARKTVVLRQFHVEGFVNTYRQAGDVDDPNVMVFESESFENLSSSWKAREKYEFASDEEFVEIFELAAPGKPFEVYSRTHLRRVRR